MRPSIHTLSKQLDIRSKAILSTLFGDLVLAHGEKIWLEDLVTLCEPLGINERLVRTSLSRLVEDDWVFSTRHGRRSFYQLSATGLEQTQRASRQIYEYRREEWNGQWILVFLVVKQFSAERKRYIETQLSWAGFGKVTANVWAHPDTGIHHRRLERMVRELKLQSSITCMQAQNLKNIGFDLQVSDRQLARLCTPLEGITADYLQYCKTFDNLNLADITAEQATCVRILLVTEYRRILLKDPLLPSDLLPREWAGEKAYRVCRKIYRRLRPASTMYYRDLVDPDLSLTLLKTPIRFG